MLVIPVYPLVLVGIIVAGLFSFAIWLMCYESVVNRKLISAAAASNSSSANNVSSRTQRHIRGRTQQQPNSTVSNSNAGLRSSAGTRDNNRTVHGDVISTNAGIRTTEDRSRRATPVASSQGNRVTGDVMSGHPSIPQRNAAFARDEQRQVDGRVIGLPSYSEAVKSGTRPEFDAPPRYEDIID